MGARRHGGVVACQDVRRKHEGQAVATTFERHTVSDRARSRIDGLGLNLNGHEPIRWRGLRCHLQVHTRALPFDEGRQGGNRGSELLDIRRPDHGLLIVVHLASAQAIDSRVRDDAVEEFPCAHSASFRRCAIGPRAEGISLFGQDGQPTGRIQDSLEHSDLWVRWITVLHQQPCTALDDADWSA